jgi:anti-sigma regulatory factor (Ser/Thr protein kinase)
MAGSTEADERREKQLDGERRLLAEFELPSRPGNERKAMEEVAHILRDANLSRPRLERLKTAVSEATMNAMEHGNGYDAEAPVTVQVFAGAGSLAVRVIDQGAGIAAADKALPNLEAKLEGAQPARGWGLFLIENMVDKVTIWRSEGQHVVEMVVYLGGEVDG